MVGVETTEAETPLGVDSVGVVQTTDAPPGNGGVEIQPAHVEEVHKPPATGM